MYHGIITLSVLGYSKMLSTHIPSHSLYSVFLQNFLFTPAFSTITVIYILSLIKLFSKFEAFWAQVTIITHYIFYPNTSPKKDTEYLTTFRS